MTGFEWFLLIIVVIVVPLTIAVVVTLWTIDQANKRKRANRKDAQIGVKRKAALSPEEAEARKAARAERLAAEAAEAANAAGPGTSHQSSTESGQEVVDHPYDKTVTRANDDESSSFGADDEASLATKADATNNNALRAE